MSGNLLLESANAARLKDFFKTKHKGLSFFRLYIDKRFNIHQLHDEYPFIPKEEDAKYGKHEYARITMEMLITKNQFSGDYEKVINGLKNYEIFGVICIPIYVPLLNHRLNVARKDDDKKASYLVTENDYINDYVEKISTYSFFAIDAMRFDIWQRNFSSPYGISQPIINQTGINVIKNRMPKKIEFLKENIDITGEFIKAMAQPQLYDLLCNYDFQSAPEVDFNDFLSLYDEEQYNWGGGNEKHILSNDKVKELIKIRFLVHVRKMFDFSWMEKTLQKELKKIKQNQQANRHKVNEYLGGEDKSEFIQQQINQYQEMLNKS